MANISDYFGGGSSGVVEAEGTASGAVTLGDPVSLSGGVVKKISGVNAQFNASSPASARFNNSNNAFHYHYQTIVRADAASGAVAMCANRNQQSPWNFYLCFAPLATTGFATGNGGPTNGITLGNFTQQGRLKDMIWDETNSAWLVYGIAGNSTSSNAYYKKIYTTNQTSGTVYTSNAYNTDQFYMRFVKDASDRIFSVQRGATSNYGFKIGRINWDTNASSVDVRGTQLASTTLHNAAVNGLGACYDATNDQIIVATTTNSTTTTYIITAVDIAANGDLSLSHTLTIPYTSFSQNFQDNYTSTLYRGIMDMEAIGGEIAIVTASGEFLGVKNTGSALTFGETRSEMFGTDSDDQCGIFAMQGVSGVFLNTRVATHNGGANPITGTYFEMANGKVAGKVTNKTIEATYQNSNRLNIEYTHGNETYYTQKFALTGTSDVLWTPYNADNSLSYIRSKDVSVTRLDTSEVAGLAKATASNGATATVSLTGATQTGLSGKSAGSKFYCDKLGTIQQGIPTTTPKAFIGTGLSASSILVGKEITVPDDPDIVKFSSPPKSLTYSGTVLNTNDLSLGFNTGMSYHMTSENVTATGTNALLSVTGSGVCQFFIVSANSASNVGTVLHVFVDGQLVINTGSISTRLLRPCSLVGEYHGNINNAAYYGTYLNHGNIQFNESFEVKNGGGTATAFTQMYKIIGV